MTDTSITRQAESTDRPSVKRHLVALPGFLLVLAGALILTVVRERLQLYARLFFDWYVWWDREIEPWRVDKLHLLVVLGGLASLGTGGLAILVNYVRHDVFRVLRHVVLAPFTLTDREGNRRLNWLALAFLIISPALAIIFNLPTIAPLEWLIEEDGITENVTALGFLSGAILAILAAYRLRATGSNYRFVQIAFLVVGAAFFFAGMEEISWGQRILGLATPEFLGARNFKGELNLHNVTVLKPLINQLFLVVAIIGTIGSALFIGLDVSGRATSAARLLLPQPLLVIPFLVVAVLMYLPDKVIDFPTVQAVAEAREVLAALAALLYGIDKFRRASSPES